MKLDNYTRIKKWVAKNPEKAKAHRIVFTALRNGTLKKKVCFCGDKKVQAHHKNYFKPLDVEWLCKEHHRKADKERKERKKNGYLCDYEDSLIPN